MNKFIENINAATTIPEMVECLKFLDTDTSKYDIEYCTNYILNTYNRTVSLGDGRYYKLEHSLEELLENNYAKVEFMDMLTKEGINITC